ncbi:MAG: hypothetical protein KA507_01365 [Candidatus Accumulibacter sp.]|jgi:hypothetical protein|uniref:hypothetical protein n=1 Tax=Candidatus Accumulibacter necessarius TaxID=2954386 RepID=UPI001B4CE9F5|nr:hypothetical protein [Accumulibacter sp.]
MVNENGPLDADDLMMLAERAAQLPASDAEWVGILLHELQRARTHEAELLAARASSGGPVDHGDGELGEQLAQIALDTAEWLRTLWNVGYMGAGNFRSLPRSAFPSIDLEDIRKSSLFARIRQGKYALPFPPPTRHGLPWHELLEGAEQVHPVEAEIVCDETGQPQGAIIEACAEWLVIEETAENQAYVVQHQGLGPVYRLRLAGGQAAELQRESPTLKRRICLQRRGGFHSYTLEWLGENGRTQLVSLRAATWDRAESEAEHWLATTHPEMYGQVCFERCEE